LQLLRGLALGHAHDLDVLRDLVDQPIDVEALAGDDDPVRDPVQIDERDAILKERRLKQVEAADLLGIRQPDVSRRLKLAEERGWLSRPAG
jgi:hypothetical protein